MGRRKEGVVVNGWVCLDKPYELGSTDAVSKVRRLFDAQKAGHAGTLDPLASGILPIALGEATKAVPQVQDGTKVYRFAIAWGSATTTDDTEGAVIATSAVRPGALIDLRGVGDAFGGQHRIVGVQQVFSKAGWRTVVDVADTASSTD